jgi:formiminotetrahydrofolate cyclodeaminase
MALRITARKTPGAALQALTERGSALMADIAAGADADVAAFALYMSAQRLPKGTEAERAARNAKRSEAASEATRVPLAAADAMIAGLELAIEALPNVAHVVTSDVLAGADLLRGAVTAVMRSVEINLSSVNDGAQAAALRQGQLARAARAEELYRRLPRER